MQAANYTEGWSEGRSGEQGVSLDVEAYVEWCVGAGGGRQLTLLSLPSSWCAYLEGAILPTYSILVTPTIAPARPHGSNFLFFNSSVSFLMA